MLRSLFGALLALMVVPPAAAGDGAAPEFTLVTLNLYHDRDDWPRRRERIVRELRALRPDAIALQEVLQDAALPNQAQWLAQQLGYDWHFASADPLGRARRFGNALLTRHRVLARGESRLRPYDNHRVAGWLCVEFHGRPLNLYVTHLHHEQDGGPVRARQIGDLLGYVEATAGQAPSLIAGDFNAAADRPELRALAPRFADAYAALHRDADGAAHGTLNPHYFESRRERIDYVWYQRDRFVPVAARILFREPDAQGVWASDHFGVLATLRVRPGRPERR